MKLDIALDKLGPSIAMLPSADAAMVAFAEVTSFVRFFIKSLADTSANFDALPKLLVTLRTAKDVDDALKKVSGEALAQWDVKWRASLAKRRRSRARRCYGLGANAARHGRLARADAARGAAPLGRDHPNEALTEIDKVSESLMPDPSLRYLRGRILEAKGDKTGAEALVEDPKAWIASYGPCWALRARLERARGDA